MAYVVKVEGKNKTLFADKLGGGIPERSKAQSFGYNQALEVADQIQTLLGKKVTVSVEAL